MTKYRRLRPEAPAATGKTAGLWALLGLQTVCTLFFLADISGDLLGFDNTPGGVMHEEFELMAVVVLVVSLVFTGRTIRNVMIRQRRIEAQLRVASGAFVEVVEMYFDKWSLTPSERDVALLAIQGHSIAEIARLRQTKEGTVKAQCNAIYGKAGVSGRPQLLSLFIEELLGDGPLRPQTAVPERRSPTAVPVDCRQSHGFSKSSLRSKNT